MSKTLEDKILGKYIEEGNKTEDINIDDFKNFLIQNIGNN